MKPIVPSSQQPIADRGGNITQYWLRFFNALVATPDAIASITVGTSPFAFSAPANGSVAVSGGTVLDISITRSKTTVSTGFTSGLVPVAAGDVVTATYSVAPTMTFIPA